MDSLEVLDELFFELEACNHLDYFREIALRHGHGNAVKEEQMWLNCPQKERLKILRRLSEIPIVRTACEWDAGPPEDWDVRTWSKESFALIPDDVQIYVYLSYSAGHFVFEMLESNIRQHFPQ